jgi:hypothetical protein
MWVLCEVVMWVLCEVGERGGKGGWMAWEMGREGGPWVVE